MVEKLIVDGKVAVLYSPGYGSGWSTQLQFDDPGRELLMFDSDIVSAVLEGDRIKAWHIAVTKYIEFGGENYLFDGGVSDLEVAWVPFGEKFRIAEYDGAEGIVLLSDMTFWTA